MRLTYRRPLALCTAAALALAAPAVAAAHGSGHGHGHHHGRARRDQAHRRHLPGEPQLRQPLRRLGGRQRARRADAAHTTQVNQAGTPYTCLLQHDVNLTSPPLPRDVHATRRPATSFTSHFPTRRSRSTTSSRRPHDCPAPGVFAPNGVLNGHGLPGGCTRDLVHRFYQEQYQLDDGKQDRYVDRQRRRRADDGLLRHAGAADLPVPARRGHPRYAIADNFFQAAFGGSFLNHQWLIAAAHAASGRTRQRRRRRRPALGASTPTGCRPTTRCTPRRPARRSRTRR